jgi:hypothetical protein
MKLKYNGKGFVPNIPARDLSEEEAREYGIMRLLNTGLYEKVGRPKEEEEETEE